MDYRVVRSARRTLAVEVTRTAEVVVRAPQRLAAARIEAFVQEKAAWIERQVARRRQYLAAHPEPTAAEAAALAARAQAELPERVAHFARLMGLHPAAVTITGARTRFGSCSSQGRLAFSWRLLNYPQAAIDYVVVHELAHLVHLNHGKEFYALVERVLPDYKQRQALLRT